MKAILDRIKYRPTFYAELMTALEQTGHNKGGFEGIANSTLKDVKIDGDKATAKASRDNKKDDLITFQKVGNGWRLELPKK
jgi:hypothetical protein